jgi:hypothetical protein
MGRKGEGYTTAEFDDTRSLLPSLCTPIVSVALPGPIGFREFSEDEYRKFIRTLSDEELIKAGQRVRIFCGDGRIRGRVVRFERRMIPRHSLITHRHVVNRAIRSQPSSPKARS